MDVYVQMGDTHTERRHHTLCYSAVQIYIFSPFFCLYIWTYINRTYINRRREKKWTCMYRWATERERHHSSKVESLCADMKKGRENKISLFCGLTRHRLFRRRPACCQFCTFPQIPADFFSHIFFVSCTFLCGRFCAFPQISAVFLSIYIYFQRHQSCCWKRAFPQILAFYTFFFTYFLGCQSCC